MSWLLPCPYCNFPMDCDRVDVGVGEVQCGPYCCGNCGASEIGPERHKDKDGHDMRENQDDRLKLDADERRTNFYKGRISPLANQHEGKVISHKQADALYREAYFKEHGNPYNAPIYRL